MYLRREIDRLFNILRFQNHYYENTKNLTFKNKVLNTHKGMGFRNYINLKIFNLLQLHTFV